MMNFGRRRRKFYFFLFFIPGVLICQSVLAQADTAAENHCYALCLQPAKVIYDTQRILIDPGGVQNVFMPALYSAQKNFIHLTPDDTFKIEQPRLYDLKEQNIRLAAVQTDTSTEGKQAFKSISLYNQIGVINVPDYIRRGISLAVTSYEMISDSNAVSHTFHPAYAVKVKKHFDQNNGETARYEILCPGRVTPDFIRVLCKVLRGKGYKTGNNTKIVDGETLKALQQYQQDNNLPVGGLNLFTLQQLKIF